VSVPITGGSVSTPGHVAYDLGWEVRRRGDELVGSGPVIPQMWTPGTQQLRTSILAMWADILAGLLAVDVLRPRVPLTLELDVHLPRPAPGAGEVRGTGRTVKAGRSVLVSGMEFVDGSGEPVAFAGASFMAAPDRNLRFHQDWTGAVGAEMPAGPLLNEPYAERAGVTSPKPGVAVLPHSPGVLNAAGTINGGLIALAAEEAVLSRSPGAALSSLGLRYLHPARVGPVVATAEVANGLGMVEARDEGNGNRLCVTAMARTFLST
jgi:acyl-coenzyme A thioesterase PaaI-like protein